MKLDRTAIKVSCQKCSLSELCLPRNLPPDEIDLLDQHIERPKSFQKGDAIFHAGENRGYLYVLRSGAVKTCSNTNDGEEQILGFHLPGELFGLDGLGGKPHNSSAIALESSTVCSLPFTELENLCHDIPSLGHHMLGLIGQEISSEQSMLMLLGKRQAEERLAAMLLSLSARLGQRGFSETDFNLSMSRQDIGNYLGLAVETVSRLFASFQEKNILKVNRRHIQILDMTNLRNLAEVGCGIRKPD